MWNSNNKSRYLRLFPDLSLLLFLCEVYEIELVIFEIFLFCCLFFITKKCCVNCFFCLYRDSQAFHAHSQSYLTLCDPMDCSLPGSSLHWIFQARILEWFAFPLPGDLPDSGIEPNSPAFLSLQVDSLPVSHWGRLSCGIYPLFYRYSAVC